MKKLLMLFFALGCLSASSPGATVNVYFAGGQSNAKQVWCESVSRVIHEHDKAALVVWARHDGQPLREWFTDYSYLGATGPHLNYLSDFYNPSPDEQATLEHAFLSVIEAGNTPVLKGLLWFQGEGDEHVPESQADDGYYRSFRAMLEALKKDFNADQLYVAMAVVYVEWNSKEIDEIRSQQIRLGQLPNIGAFDTYKMERLDGVHLADSALSVAGEKMAGILLGMMPKIPYPSDTTAQIRTYFSKLIPKLLVRINRLKKTRPSKMRKFRLNSLKAEVLLMRAAIKYLDSKAGQYPETAP